MSTPSPEEFALESQLKETNRRLLVKLSEAKAKEEELVAAVYQASRDAASALSFPAVQAPSHDRRRGTETALVVCSDWQLAKITHGRNPYNTQVCEERIEKYGDRVISLTRIQRSDHPVKEARVYLLGDLVEGELIFPGQAHLIDASLFRQVMLDGPRILGNLLRRLLSEFEHIHVVGVIGNHGSLGGRARRDYHPESNADAMMYEHTRMLLRDEKRLSWAENFSPGERHWYEVDYVGKYGFLLFHGDQVKGGFAGFPWYGFGKKLLGWHAGAVPEQFHYALSGHFHTPVRGRYGPLTHWGSGSTESSNTYAAENLAAMGDPSQWLLFAHPDKGVTAEYEVKL
jgi:hypothetical protein